MKQIFFYTLILLNSIVFSQAVITVPEFPTESEPIEITFNVAEMSNTSLLGYTGTVYTHTGVFTNLGDGDWQYVIESWGDNSTQPTLTRIGTDLYSITIENPREFYNVTTASEHILSLNFVLRSADASKKTEDLFVSIFLEEQNVKILEPINLPIYPLPGEEIEIVALTSGADSLSLFLNNQLHTVTYEDTLRTTIIASGIGRQLIILVAESNGSVYRDSSHFYVREEPIIEDIPSGMKPGINYLDNTSVLLALYAPNKKFVYTIGDFNNWEFDPDTSATWQFEDEYYFKITPDSTTYWTTLTNLTPGQEYRFQYLVDGNLRIADPYSDKILEDEDSYISENTYPNLIPYPSDKTSFSVSVFQTAQSTFQWEAIEYEKPDQTNLIIYELLLRDFVATHDYKTLIDTLDYLDNLGVNAIELMPINEFEGNESWGYNPSFYFAPDKYYGPKNDLKRFIDECHKRNIAVILDIVLNHSYGRSSFVRLYSSGDYGPPTEENPWYNVNSPNPVFSWGYDFNHESEQTKVLVDRINKYWLEEYKFDGFRFDFTKGFTNTPGDGGGYDQSRIDILKRMADNIWEFDSTAYVILEHFAPDDEEKSLSDYGMMIWGNNNYNYREATMGYNESNKSNFSRISYKNHSFTKPHLVGYMESHDEERLMYKNLLDGNSGADYDIKELNTALNRIKLAAAFFITIPGPKMIWQFGELGYDFSIDYNGRVGNKPIKWDYLNDVNRKNLYKTYSALNFLKLNYEAFSTTDFLTVFSGSNKLVQLNHESMNVMVIGNFSVENSTVLPNFQHTGIWYNYFSGDSLDVDNLQTTMTLEPGQFHIFTTEKLPTPELDILLDIDNENDLVPQKFSISQNYPNPFNPTTTIRYSIPNVASSFSLSKVILKVYDVLGREITTLVNEVKSPGNYQIQFSSENLTSGIYFYSLSAGDFHQTNKMILLK
jgi:1,4-alpha-glucan branching enzyme